jgi:hypothetical protein
MRLYAAAGQRAQALRQYQQCRDALQRELKAQPDVETERLYRQIQDETLSAPGTRAGATNPDLAPPPHGKPSIAVLPFENLSGDPEQRYFSDGITEDIITELSRNHGLLVIARHSSFQYRDRAIDIKRIGHELDVQCVEGSIRRWACKSDRCSVDRCRHRKDLWPIDTIASCRPSSRSKTK